MAVLNAPTCQCGCGKPTYIPSQNHRAKGWRKGEPRPYVRGHAPKPGGNKIPRRSFDEWWIEEDRGFATPCWVWQGGIAGGVDSYGCWVDRRAHIESYRRANGEVPVGHHLHHLCGIKHCVNPDHLEPITRSEHTRLHRPWEGHWR